jgi:integrase/recombinase XerC
MSDLIDAHIAHCRAAGFSRRTINDRRRVLQAVDRALPWGLEQASVEELTDWLAHEVDDRKEEWSNETKANYRGHICGFFRWACDPTNPLLDFDPSAALPRPSVPSRAPRPVSTEQLALALARLENPFRFWVLLAAYAGLRCLEIASTRREDITVDHIRVRGKGGKVATVPTHPLIWQAVQDFPPGLIAKSIRGGGLSEHWVSVATAAELRAVGVPATLHRFRHWLGTESLRAPGGNLRKTQELLRHSSPATTAIYTQVTDEERRAVIHALPVPAAAS